MLELRTYQREAVDAIPAYFQEADGNPLVVIPTAGGKSLVLGCFIKEALETYPGTRILVLTHVRELILQDYQELIAFWPSAPAGIYSAGLGKRDLQSQIVFAGIQSVHRHAYSLQRVDLVLIDEAHLVPRTSNTLYRRFLNDLAQINPYIKVVGLTATPFRLDSGMLHKGDDALFSDIAYEANIRDLIDAGYLCPPVSKQAAMQIDTSEVGTRGGEFVPGQLQAAANTDTAVQSVVEEMIANGADRRGWLLFGCGVDHCKSLHAALLERGISAATIFGETAAGERDRTIAAFKRQEFRCLVSMGVLTTGFNAKHVDLIGVARPTKSTGLWIQVVGRGTRLFPSKLNCLILDFGGNIARHGSVDAPKIKEPGKGDGAMPVKTCPECEAANQIAARICASCGFEFEFTGTKIETAASTLSVLSTNAPQWIDVTRVSYRRHEKEGGTPSLCVIYHCGLATHREWVCLEHTNFARQKAVQWWQKRAPGVAVPNTIWEALDLSHALNAPRQIAVRPDGKFIRVVGAIL